MNELGWDGSEWRNLVRRVARLSNRSDAEDLLHSAYIRYRDRKPDTKIGNINAFLIRTAVNLGIDEHRREQRRRLECLDTISDERSCEKSPAQDEAIAHRQSLFRISSELNRLNPRTSEILMMHRFEGLTYSEIAAKLKITPSAVEKHIAKAMAVLTQAME
ncbi:RNA polymerase sigma-70 factor (ECF subfamily) [Rhizomicrobium palustre]|uniref:RNA polymerase sigma-70 factor (ECF subfamily) n=1 Tax=Rhizomicrobium palustre TaxID=189966 RepID=A0A846MUK7_9PROT|nr:sigma-70 family RNA polymerase sigma factor [Rhizomicrobium palustre]NIK87124.1 RNA polymerase sigma-70 factor (ECF subfamily) [Rhizomicrobium palustre]